MTSTNDHNPGMPLDLDWVMGARVNRSAVERRTATLPARRSIKKEWQAAWLLRAITCLDLTTLSGDDTPGRVKRLCAKAKQPVRPDMLARLGVSDQNITVGAVCVYPSRVREAVEALKGTHIPVASVATGFPAGQTPLPQRVAEIEQAIEAGAREIDVVINRTHVLTGDWKGLYEELKKFRETCGDAAHMKTILATGDLATLKQVYQASLVAMMAGIWMRSERFKDQIRESQARLCSRNAGNGSRWYHQRATCHAANRVSKNKMPKKTWMRQASEFRMGAGGCITFGVVLKANSNASR